MHEKLLLAQQEIGVILKDKDNPYFKSKYADINTILSQVKPILNKHNLVLLQGLTHLHELDPLRVKLALHTKIIYAPSGETVASHTCPIPENPDPQKQGSAITYFRRYALQSLLALEAEDDDGNKAASKEVGQAKPLTKKAKSYLKEDEPPFPDGPAKPFEI